MKRTFIGGPLHMQRINLTSDVAAHKHDELFEGRIVSTVYLFRRFRHDHKTVEPFYLVEGAEHPINDKAIAAMLKAAELEDTNTSAGMSAANSEGEPRA